MLVGDAGLGHGIARGFKAGIGGLRLANHIEVNAGHEGGDLIDQGADAGRSDEGLRAAILEDIFHLASRQLGRDTGVIEARTLGRPRDFEIARVVFQHDGHHVARVQADRAKQLRALVRAVVQLAVGHGLTAARHDVGGFVGVLLRVNIGMHGRDP